MTKAQKRIAFSVIGFVLGVVVFWFVGLRANQASFSQKAMMENITQNIILPCHKNTVSQVTELEQQSQNLVTNLNTENLKTAQTAWKSARIAWAACELYDVAGLELMSLHHQVDKLRDSNQINQVLESDELLDSPYIETIGSPAKGFRVLEVLLFREEGGQAPLGLLQEERRQAYLVAVAENLSLKVAEVESFWQESYADSFLNSEEAIGSVKEPFNKLFNEQLFTLQLLTVDRIGYPLGKIVGAKPRPEIAMASLSQTTGEIILANLQSVKDTFTGIDGLGVEDYLINNDQKSLAKDVNERLDEILNILANLNEPLEVAIINQPEKLNEAHKMLEQLWVLMQVDVANQLAVTVTFKQLDGD